MTRPEAIAIIALLFSAEYAGVAKLDKASDYESEDSRFDSWHSHSSP